MSRPLARAPAPIAAQKADRQPPVRTGDTVGRYEILDELGRGGMGVVFRAHDRSLDRDVALKCPWPALASEVSARQRFLHEARSAARLSHPHIVKVYEVLEWDSIPWLAMELVDGRPLRIVLRDQGPLPIEMILRCAEGLADALCAAHSKRILHRDLNPNNVLVTADSWAYLTDFGLARAFAPQEVNTGLSTVSAPLTGEGHIVGTRGYMSPEQILGRTLDARTDIFSFGAVLYEMCTGERAFPGTSSGSEHDAVLNQEPRPAAALNHSIPQELERVVHKALAKRLDERYQDSRDLHADLLRLRRGAESSQRVLSTRRRLSKAWLGAVGAVALAGAALLSWRVARPSWSSRALLSGSPRRIASGGGWQAEPALSPDGSLIAYTSDASGTPDVWVVDSKGGNSLRLTLGPSGGRKPTWFPDGSALAFVADGEEGEAVWKVPRLGGPALLLVGDASDPAVSRDGRRIAFVRRNPAGYTRVRVASLADPLHSEDLTGDDGGHGDHIGPAWSPDGRTLCYADDRSLWLVNVETHKPRRLTSGSSRDERPVWSPDGAHVIFVSDREDTEALWQVSARGGLPERLTLGAGPETDVSLSRDGSRLAYSTHIRSLGIALVDVATGRRQPIKGPGNETAASFCRDGTGLVFRSTRRAGRYELWYQALSRGTPAGAPRLLSDLAGWVSLPAFSPDGQWIAFRREYEGARAEVWIAGVAGGPAARISDRAGIDQAPAWSPDGSALAWSSDRAGRCHIWVTPVLGGQRAGPSRQITFGETADDLPAWSPDGTAIAFSGSHGHDIGVWVVASDGRSPPRLVTSGPTSLGRLRWDPQTRWLWFARATVAGAPRLFRVLPREGEVVEAVKPEWLRDAAWPGEFDLSSDGRVLAVTTKDERGELWVLESSQETY